MLPYEQQREHIAIAYGIIDGIPGEMFNLNEYCNNDSVKDVKDIDTVSHSCGTLGCSLGWLSMHPYFKEFGLSLEDGYVKFDKATSTDSDGDDAAKYLFGYNAWKRLFAPYGYGTNDKKLIAEKGLPLSRWGATGSEHKELALARLKDAYYARSRRAPKKQA